jgi:insertion element IS1 protein InsB
MFCPVCGSENVVGNGTIRNGKPKIMCKDCWRQSAEDPENKSISQEKKDITDRLLPEKIPPAGIARAAGVSERWLQSYVNNKYDEIERNVIIEKKEKGRLTVECDEIWSFVSNKDNKVWICPAKDIDSKKIVGFHAGDRDGKGAQGLWDSMPGVCRQCAVCHTDFRSAYEGVFPSERHRQAGKESGKTNNIGSFNCTVRQRISRFVRKTLSFSKKNRKSYRSSMVFYPSL